ncbi:MAG: hypothetical protein IT287_02550 [Bdellovibrionaceae bacterium]|nr:hypothetical protein [Pseudobdellovibrionaceae bacterium]
MNVRSLSNAIVPISSSSIKEASSTIKSHDATERDADGRESQQSPQRDCTDEEIEKILKNLKEHPGILANNLSVELTTQNEMRVILIKDVEGQIIRRVVEKEFYQLLETIGQNNGRIISKTA